MKTKLYILFVTALLCVTMLASCEGLFGGIFGSDDDDDTALTCNKIVYTDPELDFLSVRAALSDIVGPAISMYTVDFAPETEGEIVFGDSDRAVTAAAKAELAKIVEADKNNDCGYIIYTDGKNIAIYWNIDGMGDIALAEFVDVCLVEKRLNLDSGVILSECYVRREFETEKYWLALEASADKATVDAIRKLYTFYDGSRLIQWCANLYDPDVGGFYFSQSARDTKNYLPDIESTSQLLGIVVNSGALPSRNALPEEIKHKIVDFARNLQSADDGYFYHPQWPIGKENLLTERYGRDLGNATSVIANIQFDNDGDGIYETTAYPKWCAPNGSKCELHTGTSESCDFSTSLTYYTDKFTSGVTTALSIDTASAAERLASTVRPTASIYPDYSSRESFRKWLVEYNSSIKVDSGHAHQLAALQSEITQKGYADVVLDYLDQIQAEVFEEQIKNGQEPTGLWQTAIDYNLVYSLLKYGVFYNSAQGRAIDEKYIPYIVKSCIKVTALPPSDDYRMHDIYNQWTSVSTLVKNVKKFYGSSSEQVNIIYEIMRENAAELVDNSIDKIKPFQIGDGSYAHNNNCLSNTEIYGTPIAMGVREGDVNATALCFGMYQAIFQCLGYKMVPICTAADGEMFIETLLESEPIVKQQADTKTLTFESGAITSAVTNKFYNTESSLEITDNPDGDGKSLYFYSEAGISSGDYIYFDAYSSGTSPSCNIFEADIYISSDSTDGRILEIMVGKGFMFDFEKVGDTVKLKDRSTKNINLLSEFSTDEWHRIRAELYRVDAAANGIEMPVIKIWLDNEFICVSENCYLWSNNTPSNAYGNTQVYSMMSATTYVYFDNVFCSTTDKVFDPLDENISDFRDALMD